MAVQEQTDFTVYDTDLWWMALVQGIILLLLGLWLLASPGVSATVLLWFLGLYWLVNGALHVIEALVGQTGRPRGWLLISGILGVLAGIFALNNPFFGALLATFSIVLVIALMILMEGVANLVRYTQGAGSGALILGSLSVLFGLFLLFNPPGRKRSIPI